MHSLSFLWMWSIRDSNSSPLDCQSNALARWANAPLHHCGANIRIFFLFASNDADFLPISVFIFPHQPLLQLLLVLRKGQNDLSFCSSRAPCQQVSERRMLSGLLFLSPLFISYEFWVMSLKKLFSVLLFIPFLRYVSVLTKRSSPRNSMYFLVFHVESMALRLPFAMPWRLGDKV